MEPLPVRKYCDVIEDRESGFGQRVKIAPLDQFTFERAPK
jgi:hypothetical protein